MSNEKDHLFYHQNLHKGATKNIFKNARQLRERMTLAENKLWEELRNKKLGFKFRNQHPFGNYVLDFYCHKAKLSIELDGGYHETEERKFWDKMRTQAIKEKGLVEIRFKNEEIFYDINKVMEKIKTYLPEI